MGVSKLLAFVLPVAVPEPMESLHARLFPGLSINIQRSNGEGRVLRPRGPKSGETAKMVIRIPMRQALGYFPLSHTEGVRVTTLQCPLHRRETLPWLWVPCLLSVGGAPLRSLVHLARLLRMDALPSEIFL